MPAAFGAFFDLTFGPASRRFSDVTDPTEDVGNS
jgi:hypothetical protein